MIKKVIITGANGFVGSHTTACFLNNGVSVLALDIGEKSILGDREGLVYKQCDVFDCETLKSAIDSTIYDAVIHFAWIGSAGPGRMDYQLQINNAIKTVECMKAAKETGCSRFIVAGSIMEYEVEAAMHGQDCRPGMAYIYGTGKLLAHSLCKSVAADIGVDLIWPMITNTYGVGEKSPRFVNSTLRKIINGEPLQFTAATQNYDFIYVTDVARAFYQIAVSGKPFREYMIGSGNARPLKEFIIEMRNACSPETPLTFGDIPFTGINMPIETFDTSALRDDCDFVPEVSFAQGTKMTMDWLKTEK